MPADDIPGQLRRRRGAAQRCEPLETGYRGPLDQLAPGSPSTTYRPVTVTVDGRVILVRGRVRDALRRAGLKPVWSAVTRAFVLDVDKMPDTLAALDHAAFHVTVRGRDAA
jgi:hypothetical protein